MYNVIIHSVRTQTRRGRLTTPQGQVKPLDEEKLASQLTVQLHFVLHTTRPAAFVQANSQFLQLSAPDEIPEKVNHNPAPEGIWVNPG